MNTYESHKMTICTSCKHKGTDCRPGYELIEKLRAAINAAGDAVCNDSEISSVACIDGCDRPCTVAYHGSRKATYLIGGIDPAEDIDNLVTFSQTYTTLPDGWCSSIDRPGKLRSSTRARVPSAIIAMEISTLRAS
jgi:predicted metal-binding protein